MQNVPPPLPQTFVTAPGATDAWSPQLALVRVRPRLNRIALFGAITGAVGLIVTYWPFLFGDELTQLYTTSEFWGTVTRFVLALGFPLLAFYSLRLFVQAAPGGKGAIEKRVQDNLRKMRWILMAAMFLSIIIAMLSASGRRRLAPGTYPRSTIMDVSMIGLLGPTLLYIGCFLGSAGATGDVRRALAEFVPPKTIQQGTRGFAVEFPTAAGLGSVPPPLATVAASAHDVPLVPGTTAVPAIPVSSPDSYRIEPAGGGLAERDLRAILNGLAVATVLYYMLVLSGLFTENSGNPVRYLFSQYGSRGGGLTDMRLMWRALAVFLLTLCGACWIIWCIVCISFGPRLHKPILILAWITVASSVATSLFDTQALFGGNGYYSPGYASTALYFLLCRSILPMMLLGMLTRRSVAGLFTRGSEAGEG